MYVREARTTKNTEKILYLYFNFVFVFHEQKSLPSKESKPLDAFMDLDPIGKTKPFVDKKDFFSNMRQQTSSPMLASTPMKATLTVIRWFLIFSL